jgi:sugar/nucleoside kinase (ribokinase family)
MSLTVVGSIAYDAVEAPAGKRERMLGGAATHFALAASFFDDVRVVGPVGADFGDEDFATLRTRGTNTDDVEQIADGKTFFWSGVYSENLNQRETLVTELNVFETFDPKLSQASKDSDVVFLANIQPDLQYGVLEQVSNAKFSALDSMDLWINIAKDSLLKVIKEIDCLILNDEELELLTGRPLVPACHEILDWGPSVVIAKQGKYGAAVFSKDDIFALPAYPLQAVADPTGAGDTFAGGFVGYVAAQLKNGKELDSEILRTAMAYGTSIASYNVEEFGTERVARLKPAEIEQRVHDLSKMTSFTPQTIELRS